MIDGKQPFIETQAETLRKRIFSEEVERLSKDMNFSKHDALHCTMIRLSEMYVAAVVEKNIAQDAISGMDEIDASEREFDEPPMPKLDLLISLAVLFAAFCFGVGYIIGRGF